MWKELGYQIAVIAIGTWAGVFFGLWLWCKVAGMN
ncbi:unknown [Phascolarctobacterium faecium]|jgi:hypothetical protein|uniref:Uncharacterized protein n=1 Tax=Phascolarctobacterium faecium TaxID=33025 RepID=R6I661_9FIRM|nr:unknown [Phascolarctobacterium faecium]